MFDKDASEPQDTCLIRERERERIEPQAPRLGNCNGVK